MRFLLKSFLYLGIVAGAAYLAVGHIPGLRANILEVVNPRVKETRLLDELQQSLDVVADPSSPATVTTQALTKAKALVSQISDINTDNSGLLKSGITTLVNALTSPPSPVATPAPSPCAAR